MALNKDSKLYFDDWILAYYQQQFYPQAMFLKVYKIILVCDNKSKYGICVCS